jgi:hypothetical protein
VLQHEVKSSKLLTTQTRKAWRTDPPLEVITQLQGSVEKLLAKMIRDPDTSTDEIRALYGVLLALGFLRYYVRKRYRNDN